MDTGTLQFIRLKEDTNLLPFDCGDADLNNFLFEDAKHYLEDFMAVTYLFVDSTQQKTVAYFSLLNDKVAYNPESKSVWNRINRHIRNNKRRRSYPSVKIGRLAVSKEYANLGLGSDILDEIKRTYANGNRAGCRFVTVDAYANVADFYKKNGFEFFTMTDALDSTRLMYFDLKTVKEQIANIK